jgi:hypothetical protein
MRGSFFDVISKKYDDLAFFKLVHLLLFRSKKERFEGREVPSKPVAHGSLDNEVDVSKTYWYKFCGWNSWIKKILHHI